MTKKQCINDHEYKFQAVKLVQEIEYSAVARELLHIQKHYLHRGQTCKTRRIQQYLCKTIKKYSIKQSMDSDGGSYHDNGCCESMWARMQSELLYERYDTEKVRIEDVKVLIWFYFTGYCNN